MAREAGRPYRDLTHKRDAAARGGWMEGLYDGDSGDDDDDSDDQGNGAGGSDESEVTDDSPVEPLKRPKAAPGTQKYSRSVDEVATRIEKRAMQMLNGTPVHERFSGFLHAMAVNFSMRLAGIASARDNVRFGPNLREAEFIATVIAAIAMTIKTKALEAAGQMPSLLINLKIAAVLSGKDSNDHKNLGLDTMDINLLRQLAIFAYKRGAPEEEIVFRETMLARDLTVKDRIPNLIHLATAYSMAGNEQRALEVREQLLAYLRSVIEVEYAASDMEFPLPVQIYRNRLAIANSKEKLRSGDADAKTLAPIDDERIAACTDLLEVAEVDPDFRRDALELLIGIYKRRQDFRMALRYSLRVLGVQKQQGTHDEKDRANIVGRTRALDELSSAVKSLEEALAMKDTLLIDALIEWVGEAEAQGNLQAQITLREEILKRSVLSPDGQIKTLIFLSYNYEEAGEYEKALICLERVIEIKRKIGEGSRREIRPLQERGRALLAAIPPDPAEVLAEALRNPMVRELFDFLIAFQNNAQAWVNGDSNISIPEAERPPLITAWAKIMQNEDHIVAIVGVKRLRGLMCKFRDNLKGGNMKKNVPKQILAILQPPAQQQTTAAASPARSRLG